MAAHGRCVGGWVGAVIGVFGDDLGGGDACIGSVEAGVTCVRRLMAADVAGGRERGWCGEDAERALVWVCERVAWLYEGRVAVQ